MAQFGAKILEIWRLLTENLQGHWWSQWVGYESREWRCQTQKWT